MILTLSAILAGVALLSVAAFRSEHLFILRWPRRGTFLFERTRSGRYDRIHPLALPLALARFGVARAFSVARGVEGQMGRLRLPRRHPSAARA